MLIINGSEKKKSFRNQKHVGVKYSGLNLILKTLPKYQNRIKLIKVAIKIFLLFSQESAVSAREVYISIKKTGTRPLPILLSSYLFLIITDTCSLLQNLWLKFFHSVPENLFIPRNWFSTAETWSEMKVFKKVNCWWNLSDRCLPSASEIFVSENVVSGKFSCITWRDAVTAQHEPIRIRNVPW